MVRRDLEVLAFLQRHDCVERLAGTRSRLDDGLEHWLELVRRAADHGQHVAGGGLVFERLLQLAGTRLHLLEKARVFDCDLLFVCDVASRAREANGAALPVPERDPVLARPVPCAVGMEVAVLDLKALRLAFEMRARGRLVARQIVRVDPAAPVLGRLQLVRGQAERRVEPGRVEHLVGYEIPFIDALIDRLERKLMPLLTLAQRALCLLAPGHVAHRAYQADGASLAVPQGQTVVLDPAVFAATHKDPVFAVHSG